MDYYRECFVPSCNNTTKNSPHKLFVQIREDLREKWCRQVKIEYFKVYKMYCCEDHFDPQEDLKNYPQCKMMNKDPKFKPTAVLRYVRAEDKEGSKSQLKELLMQRTNVPKAQKRKYEDTPIPSTSTYCPMPLVHAATQCSVRMVDKSTNYNIRKCVCQSQSKSTVSTVTVSTEIQSSQETSSAATPSLFGCTSETEESTVCRPKQKQPTSREIVLDIVSNKPKMYLGLPKPFLWVIDHVVEKSSIKVDALTIIVTLLKIKQNDSIERIGDQFNLSRVKLATMILIGIEVLSNFFQNFIYCPSSNLIKKNLPLVFKIRYSNVQMILDCFEIQIPKPSNPLKQAQTWSQYKNCNTVKYLLGCTPNGFVSFISEGYGGRISDKAIVQKSNLLDSLEPNAVVLADRGFKEIEALLSSRGVTVLRPPSVYSGTKPSTAEVVQSKVIASLRVHVERVIRRIREFAMLKPHAIVNYKYVPYLDEIVVIACGLINLQGEIIKSY